jgi:hypothetical protein
MKQQRKLPRLIVKVSSRRNPSGKRYRAVIQAKPGKFLLGGVRQTISSWFETRADAESFRRTMMAQANAGSSRIQVGKGRIDIGKRGSWVR